MRQIVLAAKNRQNKGSGEARRLRRRGRIPGVLYGRSGEAVSLDLDALEFKNGIKNISESTLVKIDLEGKSYEAFVKDTQRNIMDGTIIHVDFYEVESGVAVRAKVSIHLQGNSVGVREGGVLEVPLHEIEIECFPKDLPERINVDISDLKANQSIHVRDLNLGEAIRVISGLDQVIALVKFAKEETAAATEEAAAGPAEVEAKT
ncbi:MAG: 50S ribosomal protein L25 [Treponema sp.]|jgi:large subunit ribosomal protein L25|nr:50S ribosomal protein L25 [Treponema sp.]